MIEIRRLCHSQYRASLFRPFRTLMNVKGELLSSPLQGITPGKFPSLGNNYQVGSGQWGSKVALHWHSPSVNEIIHYVQWSATLVSRRAYDDNKSDK